jgi:hypothetical protein
MIPRLALALVAALSLWAPGSTLAQEPAQGGQSLEQAASDPTASLMSVQIQNVYIGDYHNLSDEDGNIVLLRSALPFQTGRLKHIARATLPVVTDSPSGDSGLGDLVLFDLIAFDKSWGRWGIGPVMLIPTASEDTLGNEQWAAGPALGAVARSHKLLWGLFNQNLFSFAGDDDRDDVQVTILQPILNYSLPDKWSVGCSEMNFTYDWDQSEWTALPLGMKLAKLVKFDKLPVQFVGSYEYNFADEDVAPRWTANLTLKFLFPI